MTKESNINTMYINIFLKSHDLIQNMSRKENNLDNDLMEKFFGIMKREMFYGYEKSIAQQKN